MLILLKVVIIGAGIAGSALYHLFKQGGDEVIAIDPRKRRIFPTLIHSLLLVDKDVYIARESLEFYKKFKIPLKEFPSFTIGKIDEKMLERWREVGVRVEEKYFEPLRTNGIYAEGGDRLVKVKELIDRVPIIKSSARILLKEKEAKVLVDDKKIDADAYILASGPWNNELFNVPSKSYYCWATLAITSQRILDKMFVYDYELHFYSRPFLGIGLNTAIIGNGESIEAKPGTKIKVNPREVLDRAEKRLGKLKEVYTAGEFCEGTPDMRPIYGKLLDNLYVIGGFDGYGAEIGPGIAKLLYEFIKSGKEEKEYLVDRFNSIKDFIIGKEPHEF